MAKENKTLTLGTLLWECQRQVAMGNADRIVLLSNDNEGDGFHECHFAFGCADDVEEANARIPDGLQRDKCILLG